MSRWSAAWAAWRDPSLVADAQHLRCEVARLDLYGGTNEVAILRAAPGGRPRIDRVPYGRQVAIRRYLGLL